MSDSNLGDLKELWQSQPIATAMLDLNAIHTRAKGFAWKVKLRNMVDYLAGAAIVIGVPLVGWHKQVGPLETVGWILAILGSLYFLYYLRKHGRAMPTQVDGSVAANLGNLILEYRRQRDLHLAAFKWYIAPFLPALAVLLVARADAWSRHDLVNAVVWIAAVIYSPLWWHKWVARKIQKSIDPLEGALKSIKE